MDAFCLRIFDAIGFRFGLALRIFDAFGFRFCLALRISFRYFGRIRLRQYRTSRAHIRLYLSTD